MIFKSTTAAPTMPAATPTENRRAAPTKLDPEKVAQIRELGSIMFQGQIAECFGVDRSMIGQVLRGTVWREDPAA